MSRRRLSVWFDSRREVLRDWRPCTLRHCERRAGKPTGIAEMPTCGGLSLRPQPRLCRGSAYAPLDVRAPGVRARGDRASDVRPLVRQPRGDRRRPGKRHPLLHARGVMARVTLTNSSLVAHRRAAPSPCAHPLAELLYIRVRSARPEQRHLDLVGADLANDRVDASRQVRHQVGQQSWIVDSYFHCRPQSVARCAAVNHGRTGSCRTG